MRRFLPLITVFLLIVAVAAATVWYQQWRSTQRHAEIERILTASEDASTGGPPAVIAPETSPSAMPAPKTTSNQPQAAFTPVAVVRVETPAAWSNDPAISSMRRSLAVGRVEDAERTLRASTAADSITQYYRGVFDARLGKRAEAIQSLQAAAADTKLAPYTQTILDVYPFFDTFQDGQSIFLDTLISRALLENGEIEMARDKLQFVTQQNGSYPDAWMLLGASELLLNHPDKAEAALRRTLPTSKADVYYWLGLATSAQKKYNDAVAFFRQAVARGVTPKSSAQEKLAENLFLSGKVEEAALAYVDALDACAEEPGCPRTEMTVRPVWINLEFLKRPEQGLLLARQAFQAEPNNAMAANLVAWSLIRLRQLPEARTYVTKSLELDPSLAAAQLNSGTLSWLEGDLVGAKRAFLRASQLDAVGSVGSQARRNLQAIEAQEASTAPSSSL